MNTVKIQIPQPHPTQVTIKQHRKRFNVVCCGRRFGKNIMLQDWGVETSLVERLPVAWSAPTYKMLLDDWKSLGNILAPVIIRKNEQEKTLELIGGGKIDFWSLDNADSIRGRKYKRFIVNEAAFVSDLVDIFNYIIRPTLIDYQGGADFAGTPKGLNGFWKMYNMDGNDWQRWQYSSYANPHIPKSELDALRETMTDRAFNQEILAQFVEDGSLFRNVYELSTLQPTESVTGRQYVIGVDWGRTYDATVFSVLDSQSKQQVQLDRMTGTDYASQRLRLKALSQKYNNAYVVAESNSIGQPNIEELQRMGVPLTGFNTTNQTKTEIIQNLELALEKREVQLLDNDVQKAELTSYESERLPSGLVRYNAPSGMHDDTVMALALALWTVTGGKQWDTIG